MNLNLIPSAKEANMSAVATPRNYRDLGFPVVALSTGRYIAVGIHSYGSLCKDATGAEMDRSEWTMLTDAEQSEAWALVDARLREHRAAKARKALR